MSLFRICIHFIRIRIQHFRLNIDPDLGFYDQKLEKKLQLKKLNIFLIKIAIYLSPGLHKGRPSYRWSLQPVKKNIQHLKTWDFLIFFYYCGSFLPLDPDPDSIPDTDPLTRFNPDPIQNTDECLGICLFIFVIMRENPNLGSEYSQSGSWQKVYLVAEGMVG